MFNQTKKAYLKIDQLVRQDKPAKPQRSTGLLGRMGNTSKATQMKESEVEDPTQRVVKIVKDMRKARMELQNGRD